MTAMANFLLVYLGCSLTLWHVNCVTKESLQCYLKIQLDKIKPIQCPTSSSGEEVAWNQYCDPSFSSVLPCPSLEDAPTLDFYNKGCILSYIYQKIDEHPEKDYRSVESTRRTLNDLFKSLPKERCGNNISDYCQRDISICYQETTDQSVCLPINQACNMTTHKELCSTTGRVASLKQQLLKFVNREPSNMSSMQNSTAAAAEQAEKSHGETIIIALVLSGSFVAITTLALCLYVSKRRQRTKATVAQVPELLVTAPLTENEKSPGTFPLGSPSPEFSTTSPLLEQKGDNGGNRHPRDSENSKPSVA